MTGVTIMEDRHAMLDFRLRRRLRAMNMDDYDEYLDYLAGSLEEQEHFVDLVTTHETYFYRTPRVWEYLENEFLPDWQANNAGTAMRAWSAASSTGEEARTLGILATDFRRRQPQFDFHVLGTDIAAPTVESARAGVYREKAIQRFRQDRPQLYQQYVSGNATTGFRASNEVEKHLQFEVHNLFSRLQHDSGFDLVLLRNVLIYFTSADQKRVMANIKALLKPGGVLIIGESESLNGIDSELEFVSPTIYRSGGKSD